MANSRIHQDTAGSAIRALLDAVSGQQPADSIACNPSPEAVLCAQHYGLLVQQVMQLAIARANLMRLRDEYKRTEHRVQALENVILPEIYAEEADIVDRLDEIDQEEVIRAHLFAKRLDRRHEAT